MSDRSPIRDLGIVPSTGLDALYRAHATSLLRMAVALTGDRALAEEVVQDAFVTFARQARPPQPGAELAYLRRSVINGLHGRFRRLAILRRQPKTRPVDLPSAELSADRRHTQQQVADAVRALPRRQRDCMVLRCYAEATDTEIAAALDISVGSVKTHLHRARASLAITLKDLR
ncbi:MAG: sigma-70 family RNA polymerase sigma factor [Acidimicrobiia bacterium]|nr:sigma-70 family RNA polymerase sigma factor [Acidimicrobiia bacterium]